jgi:prepilin-type N-terminal cleavage/methylation domain-containing protein
MKSKKRNTLKKLAKVVSVSLQGFYNKAIKNKSLLHYNLNNSENIPTKNNKLQATKGFTLVELAIVIVIIGLLVGGVLQGQELIRQSKIRSVLTAVESYKAALNTFRAKYNCLPGDCNNATTFFTSAVNGNGNLMIELNSGENLQLWKQLSISNIIKGTYSGTGVAHLMVPGSNCPIIFDNVTANVMTLTSWNMYWSNTNGVGINYLIFGAVNPSFNNQNWHPFLETSEVYSLDIKSDDGLPGRGEIRVHAPHGSIVNSSLCVSSGDANTATYSLTNGGLNCHIVYLLSL